MKRGGPRRRGFGNTKTEIDIEGLGWRENRECGRPYAEDGRLGDTRVGLGLMGGFAVSCHGEREVWISLDEGKVGRLTSPC